MGKLLRIRRSVRRKTCGSSERRTAPRDLYDVVNLLSAPIREPADRRCACLNVLQQKCAYKAIPVPTLQALLPHRAALEAMWSGHVVTPASRSSG